MKYLHYISLIPIIGLSWFEKDVPTGLVVIALITPISNLFSLVLGAINDTAKNKATKEDLKVKIEALQAETADIKSKLNNVLLAKQMGGFQ